RADRSGRDWVNAAFLEVEFGVRIGSAVAYSEIATVSQDIQCTGVRRPIALEIGPNLRDIHIQYAAARQGSQHGAPSVGTDGTFRSFWHLHIPGDSRVVAGIL